VKIRPSAIRLASVFVFGLLGLWPVLSPDAGLVYKIAGGMFVVAGFLSPVLAWRTWVRVDSTGVTVSTLFTKESFVAGQAVVRSVSVPGGPVSESKALHVEGADRKSVTIPLAFFSLGDRDLISTEVSKALKSRHRR